MSLRKRILFSFIIAGFLLLFFEVTLQLFYRATTGNWLWNWWSIPIYEEDAIRVYRLKANLDYWHKTTEFAARYQTDEAGMRSDGKHPAAAIPKPKDTFRVLSLGPSFAFGWGVNYDDAYVSRIAKELAVIGKRVELVNLGTPSQPACYQLKWLKQTGFLYDPDLIMQTVYGDMELLDTDDTIPDTRPYIKNGQLYPTQTMTFTMWVRWLRRYSALLFYGWHAYTALSPAKTPTGDGKEFYAKSSPTESRAPEDCVKRYKSYVEFVHRAVTNKPPIVFLFVPYAWVVRPTDVARVAHRGGNVDPLATRDRDSQIASVLRSNNLNVIDTSFELIKRDQETRMFNFYDIHLTVAGNKVVADCALPIIREVVSQSASTTR